MVVYILRVDTEKVKVEAIYVVDPTTAVIVHEIIECIYVLHFHYVIKISRVSNTIDARIYILYQLTKIKMLSEIILDLKFKIKYRYKNKYKYFFS